VKEEPRTIVVVVVALHAMRDGDTVRLVVQ
jgi:hypothetical protein